MAKKLNKKVAYSVAGVLILGTLFLVIYGGKYIRQRNPEYCLTKARELVKEGDFKEAESLYGNAYGYSKEDEKKITILFEMAEFHLSSGPDHEPNWNKAIGCWNMILKINPDHIDAHRKLLDYYYQMADSGVGSAWKQVQEQTDKLLEIFEKTKQPKDPLILMNNARASLEVARQGSSAYRDTLVDKAVSTFELLIKQTPEDTQLYEHLIKAILLKGELEYQKGAAEIKEGASTFALKTARDKAQEEARKVAKSAVENATDKGLANSLIFEIKLREAQTDPNLLPAARKEGEQLVAAYPDSDRLHSLMSIAYEQHTNMDRRQELDKAISHLEKAFSLCKTDKVDYAYRLASLQYRTGGFYQDKELTRRGISTAEAILTYPEATVLPGPKEGAARQYRVAVQLLLAKYYLDQSLIAQASEGESAAQVYQDKLTKIVSEIGQSLGENNIRTRQWKGMLLLVEKKSTQAFSDLYKIYQESKPLDKTGQLSNVDPYLCYILSRLAAADGALGLQREFLETALNNVNSIGVDRPEAILDYVRLMLSLQAGDRASELLKSYSAIYGHNSTIDLLDAQAKLLMNRFEDADKLLDTLDSSSQIIQIKLASVTQQISRLEGQINLRGEASVATPAEKTRLQTLRNRQQTILQQSLATSAKDTDIASLSSYCRYAVSQSRPDDARKIVDSYLKANPDNSQILILKRELDEPDPKAITPARRQELTEQTLLQIQDPLTKALSLGRFYRSIGQNDKAREQLEKAFGIAPDDKQAGSDYFSFVLEQKDIKTAESVYQKVRPANPDGCDGNLMAAQIEIAKENYPSALRRLDECLVLRPSISTAMVLKSRIYLLQKDFTNAVNAARKAFEIDPQSGIAARQLASSTYERNRDLGSKVTAQQTAEAERAVGLAMLLNPGDWQLQSIYANNLELQDPQKALAMRQILMKNTPNVSNALMLGAMAVRLAKSETDTAKQKAYLDIADNAYQQAWKVDSSDKLVQAALIEYLRVSGQQKKAEELFGQNETALWKFYLSDAQYAKAGAILEKLYQANSKDLELCQGLIDAYQGQSLWEPMKQTLDTMSRLEMTADQKLWMIQKYLDGGFNSIAEKKLVEFKGQHPDDLRGAILDAWLDMTQGRLDSALTKIGLYLEKEPNSASAWRLKGRILRLLNQPQQAIDALQRSKSITPDPYVRMEIATLYNQNGQIEAAAGELNSGLNDSQAPAQLRLLLETVYRENKRIDDLKSFYTKTLEKYPEDVFWNTRIGLYYLETKEYDKAIPLLEKCWKISSKSGKHDPMVLDNYLNALIAAQKLETALTVASGYTNGPLSTIAYSNIAAVQVQQKQNDKAVESFTKAINAAGQNTSYLLSTLAAMQKTLGSEPVEKWCSEKIKVDPKFIPANIMLSNLAENSGSFNKALTHINVCLDNTPQNSPSWIELSSRKANILIEAYSKTLDDAYLKQAVTQLENNLKLRPTDETILNNLAYLLVDNSIETAKALDYARRAYQKAPSNPVFMDTYAYALHKNGQNEQAEQLVRQLLVSYERTGSTPPWDVYKHYGMILAGQKKNKDAVAAFEKAVQFGKEIPDKEKQYLQKTIQSLQ